MEVLVSFIAGALGNGEPDENKVRNDYGDGLLSTYSVPWGTEARRRQTVASELRKQ